MGRLLFFLLIFLPNYLFAITVTWDGGGDEISWSDPINWSSNVVPCTTCDVIIETDSVVLSNNVTIKSLILGGSGKSSALYVTENSEFTIQSAIENGIKLINGSRLYLEGLISINTPLTNGLFVSNGYFYAIGKSELIINSAGELGMTTGINGKVYMGLINGHNPTFKIDNSSESGLVNLGIFEVNYGELNITNSDDNGLRNIAQFTNFATINIDNSDLASILNNTLNGHFINKNSGIININGGVNGFRNENLFENEGELNLTNSYFNAISGTFNNSGLVDIAGTGGTTSTMMLIQSKFINSGTLTIDGTFGYGMLVDNNADSLINRGQINIIDPNYFGIQHTGNPSVIFNDNSGYITIKDASYYIRGDGQVINKGQIILENTSPTFTQGFGIYLFDASSSFRNDGNIFFKKLLNGISNQGPGSQFENLGNGYLHFLNLAAGIYTKSYFSNAGEIMMERNKQTPTSILLQNLSNTDGFYNSGTMHVGYNYERSIYNTGVGSLFINEPDGIIQIDTVEKNPTNPGIGIYNERKLINRGLIEVKDTTAWTLQHFLASDSLVNSGVIRSNGIGVYSNSTSKVIANLSGGVIEGKGNFYHTGPVNNAGRISLVNGNFISSDLRNSDSLYVAIGKLTFENLINLPSGLIQTDSCADIGIETSSRFENQGIVRINSAPTIGLKFTTSSNDSLINSGQIYIKSTETGILQNDLNGVIKNLPSGLIDIDNTSVYGIDIYSDIINLGAIDINNGSVGLRSLNINGENRIENSGTINLENLTFPINSFKTIFNLSGGELIIENANSSTNCFRLENNGLLQMRNGGQGMTAKEIYNTGIIDMRNISNYGLTNPTVSNNIFHNAASGEITVDNVHDALNLYDSLINYGSIHIENCDAALSGPFKNHGEIYIKNCNTGVTGGFENKSMASLIMDSIENAVLLLNEECGYIRSNSGFDVNSQFYNYGFFAIEDSLNSHIHFKNYGTFQNTKGLRQGQYFENFGIMSGNINGKPSVGIKEFNVAIKAPGSSLQIPSFYTNAGLSTLAGGFNPPDNTVLLNAAGVQTDTLYSLRSYGSGCNTILKIPVKQNPNCGGVYPTITSSNFAFNYGNNWHNPLSWNEEVVPDDCSKVIINSKIEVPTATKARAYQIKTNAGKVFDVKLGAVLEVNSFN